jgi:tRNA-dihydrouridine synthase A
LLEIDSYHLNHLKKVMNFYLPNSTKNIHKLSIAPMMDCTDKHFRMIMRKISSEALLYTEMIVAQSLVHTNKKENFLDFNSEEHPISIQFGGDDPQILKEAAQMAQDWGYDEINFNVGCPSPRVCSGNFGASLMKDPQKVAKCIESLKNNCSLPVTIKHRIGVDNHDSFINLNNFVKCIANAGADRFTVHARKAILKGLNPKQNRTFKNIDESLEALNVFDGVMVGRSVYKHPLRWSEIDQKVYGINTKPKSASKIIYSLIPYIEEHLSNGGKSWDICKHLINLVEGIPKAKIWRNQISNKSIKKE